MKFFLSPAVQKEIFQRHKLLWSIVIGVVIFHILVVVVFGSLVMFRHIFKREVAFVAPPEIQKRLEPRKLEHKVKIKQQQQKSGRPRVQPRLSANRITDFALPEIKTNPDKVKDPIKSNLRSFGAAGLGAGTAGGQGSGGLGLGVSEVMVFGFKAKTERVAVLVDLSPSMLEDERGGFNGFTALKREIKDVIRSLNEGSFFNLITFDSSVDIFNKDAVIANRKNKEEAAAWIDPYMTSPEDINRNGTLIKTYKIKPETPVLPSPGGVTRFDLAIAAAMESGVDTMFIITDGVHHIQREITPEFLKEQAKLEEQRLKDPSRKRNEKRNAELREEFEEKVRKETESRAKRGLPPRVIEGGRGYGIGGPSISPGHYDDASVLAYVEELTKALYKNKGKKAPRIYVIGYVTTPGTERFLRMLATQNSGSFKRTRTLAKPIKSDAF